MNDNLKKTTSYAKFLPLLLFFIDYLIIIAAEQTAVVLRNYFMHGGYLHISWINFWIIFPAVYMLFIQIEQLYHRRRPLYVEIEKIFKACVYGTLCLIVMVYLAHLANITSRLFVLLYSILTFTFLSIARYSVKKLLRKYNLLQVKLLIIGAGKTAELLVKLIEADPGMSYKIIGFLEDNGIKSDALKKYPVLGGFADAEKVIKETGVKRVCIAAPGLEEHKLGELVYRIQPLVKNVGIIPRLVGIPASNIEAESIFNEKMLYLRIKNNLARPINLVIKSIFDYVLTIIGTILISPVLLIIALWIAKDSPGPIIYDGVRLGKNGKLFKCYKFRSMYTNGDEILKKYLAEHPEKMEEWKTFHKLEDDPRVTKAGAFMRRTSIDELPQIFNVLLGDMSLVGPRPYLPSEKEEMGDSANTILMTKPGITGFWQVSGRSNVTFEDRLQMDNWYVYNWSVWIDIVLLFKTVAVVLLRKGAY